MQSYLDFSSGQSAVTGHATGSGYPGVPMAGFYYAVVMAGSTYGVSGTSCASPVVADFAGLCTTVPCSLMGTFRQVQSGPTARMSVVTAQALDASGLLVNTGATCGCTLHALPEQVFEWTDLLSTVSRCKQAWREAAIAVRMQAFVMV